MYSLSLECADAESELLSAELWDAGATGIHEEPLPGARCRLRAWFDQPDGLETTFAAHHPHLELEPDVDWEAACRQAWQPFPLGQRLYLAPEWDESRTPAGRLRLTIHPGQALGTGAHPATQLALESLEAEVRPGDAVLDVGTGSGILTAAALLLGARFAHGCDIDEASVIVARANLLADAVAGHVFVGSTRAVRSKSVDLVVANINATTHEMLAGEYARLARRGAILTGFPEPHRERVEAALTRHGLTVAAIRRQGEWVALSATLRA
jgi:ribosomal protein L11 methyltransferase